MTGKVIPFVDGSHQFRYRFESAGVAAEQAYIHFKKEKEEETRCIFHF